jgi:hypothetical protein
MGKTSARANDNPGWIMIIIDNPPTSNKTISEFQSGSTYQRSSQGEDVVTRSQPCYSLQFIREKRTWCTTYK